MKHLFKGLLVVFVFGVVLWAGWAKYQSFLTAGARPPEGTLKLNTMEKAGVPDFELADLSGKPVHLSEFKDRVVVLNFWASWCDPCVAEFPSMLKLVDFFKGKVVLVAVSADNSVDDIRRFLKSFGGDKSENVVILWDKERKVAETYGTEALPESYVLGRGLRLIRKVAGSEDWFSAPAVALFQEILKAEDASEHQGELPKAESKSSGGH